MSPAEPKTSSQTTMRSAKLECVMDSQWAAVLQPLLEKHSPEEWAQKLPGWQELKRSTVRQVLRGEIPNILEGHSEGQQTLPVYLKLFRAVRLSDRARDLLSGSRSMREFRNLQEAQARGLPCVQALAAGSVRGSLGSRSFLLTLGQAGQALARGPLEPELASKVGGLLRQAHDLGLHAQDLHPGNLLLGDDGRCYLLDLTSAALADALDQQQRARALAFFCQDLDGMVQDPAAAPLLQAYGASNELKHKALQAGQVLRQHALASFGRRALRACRHTRLERGHRQPRWFWHQPAAELWDQARRCQQQLPDLPAEKQGRRGAVFLHEDLAVKQRNAAAARRLFVASYLLQFTGVASPQPVGLQTFNGQGCVFWRRLPWPNLEAELATGMAAKDMLACAGNLGQAVGRLHGFGLRNRDLKFENLCRDPQSNRILMLDLDGIKRRSLHDMRGRAADLGRLLAAFQNAGELVGNGTPSGNKLMLTFLRRYIESCKNLCLPTTLPHLLKLTVANASTWASAHRNTPAS